VARREEFAAMARELLEDVLPLPQPVRLMGLTLSALEGGAGVVIAPAPAPAGEAAQMDLF